jgi:hypothetical protein
MEENTVEIYMIQNNVNDKKYVGQAQKTMGATNQTWGTFGRWKSHLREATNSISKGQKDHCVVLNQAIRKYGETSFTVTKLEDVTCNKADEREVYYIEFHKSLVPNGYNLKTGGSKGKDSEETRQKKRDMRLNQKHSEDTKKNIAIGQLGNRRGTKVRKNPDDANLPKYVNALRYKSILIGYAVQGFPIGTVRPEYIARSFINKEKPEAALDSALTFLNELKEKYNESDVPDIPKNSDPPVPRSVERNARKNKAGSDKYDMPKYVILVKKKGEEIGFAVDGIRIYDSQNKIKKYNKKFTDITKTMPELLALAISHLEIIKNTYKCLIDDVKA